MDSWYIGIVIAFVLVWVVVICVATILNLARRISVQAREIALALSATGCNTDVLQVIPAVNEQVANVYAGVGGVRAKLFGGGR
jgi:predicted Holliday junction resolvase-like endonuclease